MHIPDGFFNAATSLAAGGAAAATLGVAAKRAARELNDRQAPLAGLVAAFIFAVQMLNFPVAAGTSGHLLGATLAAVLVGPWAAIVSLSVVLAVQALFADGGLSALGLNIVLIAVIPAFAGYALFLAARQLVPRTRRGVALAAGVGAGLSVPVAAAAFAVLFGVGGTADIALGRLLAAVVGVHVLIGVGEALITAATISAVVAVRPDLVHGARHLLPAVDVAPSSRAPVRQGAP